MARGIRAEAAVSICPGARAALLLEPSCLFWMRFAGLAVCPRAGPVLCSVAFMAVSFLLPAYEEFCRVFMRLFWRVELSFFRVIRSRCRARLGNVFESVC